ncbi:AraC family transcriptional regulator [Acidomonas methanolica]|uniref:AraC family transcriptional regulator n=1 Tax=Acidomonas methanolica TaxID=437 RepID=UPI00211A6890|nr:AraC family transcriptional regulator [Acidomonas methanolica]MCQ9157057.1 AraC family transcriptional regulator [Acidomonas methanolica]
MLVPIYYVPQILQQVALRGHNTQDLLASAGIVVEDLGNASHKIPLTDFKALIRDALKLSGEPGLGLLVGRGLNPASHGIVGFAASSGASIADAMAIVARFLALRTPLVTMKIESDADEFRVVLDASPELDDTASLVLEVALVAVKNIADSLVLGGGICQRVHFAFPEPAYVGLSRDILGCDVLYGMAWSGMVFPLSGAMVKLSQHDAFVLQEAQLICQAELERVEHRGSLSEKIENMILKRQGEFLSLEQAAKLLNITPRTLERRLLDEHTTYQDIVCQLRRRIAHRYLCVDRISTKEAAFLLGYSDVANFRRAFKRWEGMPPSVFRRQTGKAS